MAKRNGATGTSGSTNTVEQAVAPRTGKGKANQPKVCACGCGDPTRGGEFAMGHDARHKGNLLKAARNGDAEARAALVGQGWATDASIDATGGKPTEEERRQRQHERLTAKLDKARSEVARLEAELAALAG